MSVANIEIAQCFETLADLLEVQEANPFRVRAYRTAARTVRELPQAIVAMLARGEDLSELPGIGKDLAGKIAEIVETGHLSLLEEVKAETPAGLAELLALPSLGPKRVEQLHQALGIKNLADLNKALKRGRLVGLRGFGPKLIERLGQEAGRRATTQRRFKLMEAEQIAAPLLAHLEAVPGVIHVTAAGSYRRRRETVGDIDIVVTARRGSPVMERFLGYDEVDHVVAKGPTRATVILRSGMQVDLRLVAEASYGSALTYFTGSKAHNIAIRRLGMKGGLKINEYGVFKADKRVAGRTEAEVYATVGLPYIEPELREDRGEIEAAAAGTLPRLVEAGDIRGDLHAHTKASDGRLSIADMAAAAKAQGYAYLAISDHTKHVTIAHGLDARRLAAQIDTIDRLNETIEGITLLKSAEVDILADGSLDMADSVLARLDFTVCAIHYKFDMPVEQQTERVLRAMDNPHFTILAHPTGRLIGEREPYAIDLERIVRAALERGCFLEINAQPDRLDLSDEYCRMAKEMGLKLAVSTDAHSDVELGFMRFGIDQARRGWLEPDDVLNTRPLPALRRLLRRR